MQQSSNPTRLYEIVVVLIRLLAIKIGLDALSFLLTQYPKDPHPQVGLMLLGVVVICAYCLWQLSPFFACRITRGQDSALDCGSLTLGDLYAFAFLFVGLYLATDSFGPSLTWFHYSLRESASDAALSAQQRTNYYTLFKYLVRLFLGLALIFNGRRFATKLIKREDETA